MVSRRRIEALEEDVGLRDPAPCPACGHVDADGWVLHVERFVDPDTHQQYLEPSPPEPCKTCGSRPLVFVISCILASWKRPGAPKETATVMSDAEAGCWWRDFGGSPTLGQWFLSRAGLAEPPARADCRLVHFNGFDEDSPP